MSNKALLVGINLYQADDISNLTGCVNDVTNIRHILANYFTFDPDNISLLINESATRKQIKQRLNWLISDVHSGDQIVFFYSGHGSQIRDLNGDEQERNLNDVMDEMLCPYDLDWRNPKTYLLDDKLDKWTKKLPTGVKLTVILDCCNSGTGTREVIPPGVAAPQSRSLSAPVGWDNFWPYRSPVGPACCPSCGTPSVATYGITARPASPTVRFAKPRLDIWARGDRLKPLKTRRLLHNFFERSNGLNHILLTACRDTQISVEEPIEGRPSGVFTYYLCKTIRDLLGQLTYAELIDRVRQSLEFNGYGQVPQIEGTGINSPIFT